MTAEERAEEICRFATSRWYTAGVSLRGKHEAWAIHKGEQVYAVGKARAEAECALIRKLRRGTANDEHTANLPESVRGGERKDTAAASHRIGERQCG